MLEVCRDHLVSFIRLASLYLSIYLINRESSDSSSEYEDVLPDNTLEMENNLHASAMKNNLDDISVRKILKVNIYEHYR